MQGRLVNERGYLIDKEGNIIDVTNRILWYKREL